MENATFRDFLQEYIDIKGFSTKKLCDATGIPERYLEALLESNNDALPPAPYVRGYIGKLADVLDFNKEEMWRLYKKEAAFLSSGAQDRLPGNRFAIKRINKRSVIAGVCGILLLTYVGTNFNKLLGAPQLEITYPTTNNLIVHQPTVSIEGKTSSDNKLTINDEELFVDDDGRFKKEFNLDPGLNALTIVSKKFLGREKEIIKKIIYEPPRKIKIETNE